MFKAAVVVAVLTFSSVVYGSECKTIKSVTLTQAPESRTIVTAGYGNDVTESFVYGTYNVATALPATSYIQTLLAALQVKAKVCMTGSFGDGTLNIHVER